MSEYDINSVFKNGSICYIYVTGSYIHYSSKNDDVKKEIPFSSAW